MAAHPNFGKKRCHPWWDGKGLKLSAPIFIPSHASCCFGAFYDGVHMEVRNMVWNLLSDLIIGSTMDHNLGMHVCVVESDFIKRVYYFKYIHTRILCYLCLIKNL